MWEQYGCVLTQFDLGGGQNAVFFCCCQICTICLFVLFLFVVVLLVLQL